MIDNLVLLMIHGLLGLAAWRLLLRDDLDADPVVTPPEEAAPSPAPDAHVSSVPRLKRLQVPRD